MDIMKVKEVDGRNVRPKLLAKLEKSGDWAVSEAVLKSIIPNAEAAALIKKATA